jgi:predicted RNA binding protein YcfA (HicA-like mRNA interferase family)
LKRVRGSHHIYAKPGAEIILVIPVHSNLPIGTLKSLLKDAELTEADLD